MNFNLILRVAADKAAKKHANNPHDTPSTTNLQQVLDKMHPINYTTIHKFNGAKFQKKKTNTIDKSEVSLQTSTYVVFN